MPPVPGLLAQRKPRRPLPDFKPVSPVTIGLPAGLHLVEDLAMWEHFFQLLGIRTRTSRHLKQPVQKGQPLIQAEFCAPITAMHGHVAHLLKKTDHIFLPFYFEDRPPEKGLRRQHCYYTQYLPAMVKQMDQPHKILSPTIRYLYTGFHTRMELYRCLTPIFPHLSFFDISSAWDRAESRHRREKQKLNDQFKKEMDRPDDLKVIFLGRPYTLLSGAMNKNIPQLFEKLGVTTLFQDMVDIRPEEIRELGPLLSEIHWKYAARILAAARKAAETPGLYPVYVSSFKCSPDAFTVDYVKQIMDGFDKPYLILELDEHDSSVGYETRVEAAVRAFTNHFDHHRGPGRPTAPLYLSPRYTRTAQGKTIVFPNWDSITGHLLVSTMKGQGQNALLMEETEETLKKAMLTNTGQCIPLNAMAAGFIHTVEKHGLSPASCLLWLNESEIACNIKMYPYQILKILKAHGGGFENAGIYKGELSLSDISLSAAMDAYFAYLFGGLLRRIGCRIRPYEIRKGETDTVLEQARVILGTAFLTNGSKEKALEEVISLFLAIQTRERGSRPKVAIFGDLYARDNDILNQGLIPFIEAQGGEVVTTPYATYVKLIANTYFKKWFKEGKYLNLMSNKAIFTMVQALEKKYHPHFLKILPESELLVESCNESILDLYGLTPAHTGESMDNILKIHHLAEAHPDLALLVQTNPAFCCPGMVTEAMAAQIEKRTGVPIVSLTYDISGGNKNRVITPFLQNLNRTTDGTELRKMEHR